MRRVRCAVHIHRRLQQIAIICKRSDHNEKSYKVSHLSSVVKKPHNGSLLLWCRSFHELGGAWLLIGEEFEVHQDRSGELDVLMGQSIVLGEIKAEVPLQNENFMNDQILWQHYIQQIESLSPESKVSRFCKEAEFMRVVEVGQYLVTKDTGNLRQFVQWLVVITLFFEIIQLLNQWIQGNTRIGPILEVTTSFRHFKYGIEIRIWSVNQDNSQSWVRISYGTIKYVVDSIQDNTEIPADPQEEESLQTSSSVVAVRSKAKAKPREITETTTTIPIDGLTLSHQNKILPRTIFRRKWSIFFDTINRYRGRTMEQFNSTKSNSIFEIIIHKYIIGLMECLFDCWRRIQTKISVLLW